MKRIIAIFMLSAISVVLSAEDNDIKAPVQVGAEMRFDYANDLGRPGLYGESDNGFKVNKLYVKVDGGFQIRNHKFTYKFCQQLNKMNLDGRFMESIDWAFLAWNPTERLSFQAGKLVEQMGSWEYDANPIDVSFTDEYYNHIGWCQLGVGASYKLNGGDLLMVQFMQSPYDKDHLNLFAYNFSWRGSHGFWSPLYSVNMQECEVGNWMATVSLGNKFTFGSFSFFLDWMQRASTGYMKEGNSFFDNHTAVFRADWSFCKYADIFLRVSHECNKGDQADWSVLSYSNYHNFGGGFLVYPFVDKNVRLHAFFYYTKGELNPYCFYKDGGMLLNVGATWKIAIYKRK